MLSNQQDEVGFVSDEGFDVAQAYHDSARSQTISPKSEFIGIITILLSCSVTKHHRNMSKHVWPMHRFPYHQVPSLSAEELTCRRCLEHTHIEELCPLPPPLAILVLRLFEVAASFLFSLSSIWCLAAKIEVSMVGIPVLCVKSADLDDQTCCTYLNSIIAETGCG